MAFGNSTLKEELILLMSESAPSQEVKLLWKSRGGQWDRGEGGWRAVQGSQHTEEKGQAVQCSQVLK